MDSGQNWVTALKAPAAKVVADCRMCTAAEPAKVAGVNEECVDRVLVGLQMAGLAGVVGRRSVSRRRASTRLEAATVGCVGDSFEVESLWD